MGGRENDAVEKRFGLLRRVSLFAVRAFQPLRPAADRQHPVRPHLQAVIHALHGFIVEDMTRGFGFRRPDQRFMGVGQPSAAEVRHRVRLDPHDVVQNPKALILKRGAEAEDVVVGADHPDRPIGLQDPARFAQPRQGEGVVFSEAREFVPVLIDAVDFRIVRSAQHRAAIFGADLKIVRRVGENQVDAGVGHLAHQFDAVALMNGVEPAVCKGGGDVHDRRPIRLRAGSDCGGYG